jgi:hypothetical protein
MAGDDVLHGQWDIPGDDQRTVLGHFDPAIALGIIGHHVLLFSSGGHKNF